MDNVSCCQSEMSPWLPQPRGRLCCHPIHTGTASSASSAIFGNTFLIRIHKTAFLQSSAWKAKHPSLPYPQISGSTGTPTWFHCTVCILSWGKKEHKIPQMWKVVKLVWRIFPWKFPLFLCHSNLKNTFLNIKRVIPKKTKGENNWYQRMDFLWFYIICVGKGISDNSPDFERRYFGILLVSVTGTDSDYRYNQPLSSKCINVLRRSYRLLFIIQTYSLLYWFKY